jgi:hypothetical protein
VIRYLKCNQHINVVNLLGTDIVTYITITYRINPCNIFGTYLDLDVCMNYE